jgi:hypothetical protein
LSGLRIRNITYGSNINFAAALYLHYIDVYAFARNGFVGNLILRAEEDSIVRGHSCETTTCLFGKIKSRIPSAAATKALSSMLYNTSGEIHNNFTATITFR